MNTSNTIPKIGILGGGQLGRMLIQAGVDMNIPFTALDPDPNAPCSYFSGNKTGSITDFETVLAFGRSCDGLTIEIEHINIEALKQLEKEGKTIFPQPHVVELIQDKQKQKIVYQKHNIATAQFVCTANRDDVKKHHHLFPAVHKIAKSGYDGQGVRMLHTPKDIDKAFDAPAVLEKKIDVEKEVAVLGAQNKQGQRVIYSPVEMIFNPEANLIEHLYAPARLSPHLIDKAKKLAIQTMDALNIVGVIAVEMFITRDEKILVNEVAPRPHNSGHHTIEAHQTSQYHQHLRILLNLPLGDTHLISPCAMINILGTPEKIGPARYEGLAEAMAIPGVYIHLYGKKTTKPLRKMGHITILDPDPVSLEDKISFIKQHVKVTT